MLKCKYCGWDLPEDARVCTYCGHPVEPEDDEQKRRLKLKWHLSALVIGMNAPKSAFLLSTAKTSNARPQAALVVFLLSTTILVNIIVIGAIWLDRLGFRLPRLPGCRKQGQLIGR